MLVVGWKVKGMRGGEEEGGVGWWMKSWRGRAGGRGEARGRRYICRNRIGGKGRYEIGGGARNGEKGQRGIEKGGGRLQHCSRRHFRVSHASVGGTLCLGIPLGIPMKGEADGRGVLGTRCSWVMLCDLKYLEGRCPYCDSYDKNRETEIETENKNRNRRNANLRP